MSLQNVKAFYERLASDEAFRTQLQAVKSKEECSQIVKNAGYDFTTDEFEEYTAQLLESSSDNNEIKDLDEKELEAVFGGASPTVDLDLADVYPDLDLSNIDLTKIIETQIDIISTKGQAMYGVVVGGNDLLVVNGDLEIQAVTNDDLQNRIIGQLPNH